MRKMSKAGVPHRAGLCRFSDITSSGHGALMVYSRVCAEVQMEVQMELQGGRG